MDKRIQICSEPGCKTMSLKPTCKKCKLPEGSIAWIDKMLAIPKTSTLGKLL